MLKNVPDYPNSNKGEPYQLQMKAVVYLQTLKHYHFHTLDF